jgi:hypothetical protein
MIRHWKTSLFGLLCIIWGLWLAHVTYVPTNTLRFNLVYVWPAAELFLITGLGLIHAKDHDK